MDLRESIYWFYRKERRRGHPSADGWPLATSGCSAGRLVVRHDLPVTLRPEVVSTLGRHERFGGCDVTLQLVDCPLVEVSHGLERLDLLAQLLVGAVDEQSREAVPGEPGDAQGAAEADQRDGEVVAEPAGGLDRVSRLDEPEAGDPDPHQVQRSAPDQDEGRAVHGRADLVLLLEPGGDDDDRLPDEAGVALGDRMPLAELVEHDDGDPECEEAKSHDDGGGHDAPFCCARV